MHRDDEDFGTFGEDYPAVFKPLRNMTELNLRSVRAEEDTVEIDVSDVMEVEEVNISRTTTKPLPQEILSAHLAELTVGTRPTAPIKQAVLDVVLATMTRTDL